MGRKKIPLSFIDGLCAQAFQAKGKEIYFRCLVKYSQATSPSERQKLSGELINLIKVHANVRLIEEKSEFISSPLLPRIFCLLSFKDLITTSENIAKFLNISLPVIESALSLHEELELVEKQTLETGTHWRSLNEVFKVPDSCGDISLMKFHAQSLQDAIDAYGKTKELRRYKSLFIPMGEDDVKEFNKAMDDFSATQVLKYNSKVGSGKRMFQPNFNVHAVSEAMS